MGLIIGHLGGAEDIVHGGGEVHALFLHLEGFIQEFGGDLAFRNTIQLIE